jgi:prepilin-type processing-associated H-X9-DG protein
MSANLGNDPEFITPEPKPIPRRRFRLIELTVILGIIVFLIALFLPARRTSREAALRARCLNNLQQIVLALHNYEHVHGALPPAHTVDAKGRPLHSWRTLILPYLGEERLYETIDLAKPWSDPANAKVLETPLSVYHCPDGGESEITTTYLAIASPNGSLLPNQPRRLAEITDPHASTLVVIDVAEKDAVPWMAPVDANESLVLDLGPTTKLHHPGGTNVGFVDGHVDFMKVETPGTVRRALMSVSGGDQFYADEW